MRRSYYQSVVLFLFHLIYLIDKTIVMRAEYKSSFWLINANAYHIFELLFLIGWLFHIHITSNLVDMPNTIQRKILIQRLPWLRKLLVSFSFSIINLQGISNQSQTKTLNIRDTHFKFMRLIPLQIGSIAIPQSLGFYLAKT